MATAPILIFLNGSHDAVAGPDATTKAGLCEVGQIYLSNLRLLLLYSFSMTKIFVTGNYTTLRIYPKVDQGCFDRSLFGVALLPSLAFTGLH